MPPDFDQQAMLLYVRCIRLFLEDKKDDSQQACHDVLSAAYRAGLEENNLKARQYDSVVEAVNAADGGRYRADTLAALLARLRDAERREREAYRAGLEHAAQLADGSCYGKEAAARIREEMA